MIVLNSTSEERKEIQDVEAQQVLTFTQKRKRTKNWNQEINLWKAVVRQRLCMELQISKNWKIKTKANWFMRRCKRKSRVTKKINVVIINSISHGNHWKIAFSILQQKEPQKLVWEKPSKRNIRLKKMQSKEFMLRILLN